MAAQIIKLSHVQAIIKFSPDSPGQGGNWTIGLGTTGFSGQVIGTGNTLGIALFGTGDSEAIGTPRVHIRQAKWTVQSGTTGGIRVTRNNVDTLQLFYHGEMDTGSISENETSNIVINIDGSGTLILDLAKRDGYENNQGYTNQLYRQNLNPIYRG